MNKHKIDIEFVKSMAKSFPHPEDLINSKNFLFQKIKCPEDFGLLEYIMQSLFSSDNYDSFSNVQIETYHSVTLTYIFIHYDFFKDYVCDGNVYYRGFFPNSYYNITQDTNDFKTEYVRNIIQFFKDNNTK